MCRKFVIDTYGPERMNPKALVTPPGDQYQVKFYYMHKKEVQSVAFILHL